MMHQAVELALKECDPKEAICNIIFGHPDRFIWMPRAQRLRRIHYGDPRYKNAPFEENLRAHPVFEK